MKHTAVLPLISQMLLLSPCFAQATSEVSTNNKPFTLIERAILNIEKPGYLHVIKNPKTLQEHLFVSNFKLFGKDRLFSISNLNKGLSDSTQLETKVFSNAATWPNEARAADPNLFGEDGVIVSGGFLVPGKATGAVTFIPWSSTSQHFVLTTPKKGWFYHRTEEYDVNGDGLLDIVTARALKPMFGKPDGELLWLENPGDTMASSGKPWKEHIIGRGPDVHFKILPDSIAQELTIISTEFSGQKLSAYQRQQDGNFKYILLDDTLGSAFDIQLTDLNSDGMVDLLVSNHEHDHNASVFAYEFEPQTLDIKRRHTLISGIETKQKGIQSASPGPVMAFYPTTANGLKTNRPWILVSGDGSQKAHLLTPTKDKSTVDWNYTEHIVWHPSSTVGQSTIADIDNDGILELIIPAYDANQIGIFSLKPTIAP